MDKHKPDIRVIIPAFNEERSIAHVIRDIPNDWVREIIVVNNASTDQTAEVAKSAGATVLNEMKPGYGGACLKGVGYLREHQPQTEIVVFIDGDYSDYPHQLPELVRPIIDEGFDLVIGSRALGTRESGSMTIPQVFGNWLATGLLKLFYNTSFTDLGPFRAIRFDRLKEIGMRDQDYGWTVEMQLKAAKQQLKCTEVAVNYKRRIGVSKVSGTVKGTVMAGYKILYTIFKYL
ncbi:MAG TPA: glycosyltransferase family 2 protein [Roseivirga sp.]